MSRRVATLKRLIKDNIKIDDLADKILFASLVLMIGTSCVSFFYIAFANYTGIGLRLNVFQIIASASLVISQMFGLAGLIYWSATREKDK